MPYGRFFEYLLQICWEVIVAEAHDYTPAVVVNHLLLIETRE